MLIGRTIEIMYVPARKITAEYAGIRRAVNRLSAPLRTLRLTSRFSSGFFVPGPAVQIYRSRMMVFLGTGVVTGMLTQALVLLRCYG